MNTLKESKLIIRCPHCGDNFSPEDAIGHDLRIQIEREFETKLRERSKRMEEKIRQEESERFRLQLDAIKQESQSRNQRLKLLEEEAITIRQREADLREREERIELEMKKRLLERERVIREQADKAALEKAIFQVREREQKLERERETLELMLKKRLVEETDKAREEERMKNLELQKKLDDQTRLINEMKRKAEQGSMQLQGEVQELAIEEHLRTLFPLDEIQEIGKGKRGGDCLHVVKNHYGQLCGKILYESKRTRHFSYEWVVKLKEDMRLNQADLAVIITEALPAGMTRFGEIDGVWVCSFAEFRALCVLFRSQIFRIGEVLASQENKGEKMNMIYAYVTGVEFRQKLEAAFEAFNEMQEDLQKEKAMLVSQWARREKRLLKAMENLVCLYGDVRGIAGGAVQEIRSLEMHEQSLLEE